MATSLKFDAIGKAAKKTTKAVKGTAAYKATRGATKKAPKPVKALPVVASVGVAGAVAARKRRNHEDTPASAGTPGDDHRQQEPTAA